MFRKLVQTHIQGRHKVNKYFFRFLTGSIENEAANAGPLSGVRILDFSRIVAGPYCTMILGDLGAEIIKVENPHGGDESRSFGHSYIEKENVYFMSLNRNKKSVAIDLKTERGRDLIKELAKKSDVLVENFLPGKMTDSGLDYENMKSIAPSLIYCSITGFGSTGPYKHRPGVDLIAASVGGLLHITGPEKGTPCTIGVPMTDIATGLYAHGAIMVALLQRIRTGKGQNIECDLLSSQVSTIPTAATDYLNTGKDLKRLGSKVDGLVPYEAFETKNGYLALTTVSNKALQELCKILELPDYSLDPKFSSNIARLKNRNELEPILEKKFKTNTTERWLELFRDSHIPYGPVNNMEGVFKDPQVIHKKMVCNVQHSSIGNFKVIKPAVTYSYSSNEVRSPPPVLGEHTSNVLSDVLSYTSENIQELKASKVIG